MHSTRHSTDARRYKKQGLRPPCNCRVRNIRIRSEKKNRTSEAKQYADWDQTTFKRPLIFYSSTYRPPRHLGDSRSSGGTLGRDLFMDTVPIFRTTRSNICQKQTIQRMVRTEYAFWQGVVLIKPITIIITTTREKIIITIERAK